MHINPLNFIVKNLTLGPHLNVREVNGLIWKKTKDTGTGRKFVYAI